MKIIQIIHNPTAGDGSHSEESLVNMVRNSGLEYNYSSTDDSDWKNFHQNKRDAFLVAGGDGTVRKLAVELLENPSIQRKPIILLPLGTANNISETLKASPETFILKLDLQGNIKKFDCGKITGLDNEKYFLEGLGFGVFPALIKEMENAEIKTEGPEDELKKTLEILIDIVKNFKSKKVKIKADGIKIKGRFLLVELMNIQNIGPNLKLAPNADPGDAFFELVMIPEDARDEFVHYLESIMEGRMDHVNQERFIKILRVKKIKLKSKGDDIHVDDDVVSGYSGKSFTADVLPGALEFYV